MIAYPRPIDLFIDGQWRAATGTGSQPILNPATGESLGVLRHASKGDLDHALDAAWRGFEIWRREAPSARANLIRRAAALLRADVDSLSQIITLEQGKPLAEAKGEVVRAAEILEWDAGEAQRAYGRLVPGASNLRQSVIARPIGPVAAFATWNVPVISPSRKIGGALAAGCSVVIKASEETPASAIALVKCFEKAGLPPGVLNLVFGDPAEISAYLIASPKIRMATLTGPIHVGKTIAGLCAQNMKPANLELGGHSPLIVCDDVDAVAAGRLTASARYRNAGQICTAPTRLMVHEKLYQPFVDAFIARTRELRVGDGADIANDMGPMANPRRIAAMETFMADALRRGAKCGLGGNRIGNQGFFFEPTVLTDVPAHALLMNEEPFGPIALIAPFATLDEAIAQANALPYGLAAYAYTKSIDRVAQLSAELESGSLCINHVNGAALPELPLGGVKESGYGHEGGAESLDAYMTKMVVSEAIGADL
ncbi:MAG: NAD-dependent succinate-semialdehyde dehydrogenase [Alphaproteobacteria bacterium]